jgi:uncharacterized protein YecE (DUF72 family)
MNKLYIGTSGYIYKDWKEKFYPTSIPQKNWLSYYSTQFSTVEINASFYKTLSVNTYQKWREQVGEDFKFVLKGPRFITHMKKIKDVDDSIELFFGNATALSETFKITLWQFPKFFTLLNDRDERIERLSRFLSLLPTNIKQVFEFRHESWFIKEVFSLLNKHDAGFVINDSPEFPSVEKVTGNIVYIRFHGPGKLYSTSYSQEQLKLWTRKIKKYLKNYDVYWYFNNDVSGYAIQNAQELKVLLLKA